MPIYVYRCPNCDHQFDKMQPFSAASIYPCPNCNAEAKRQLQPAGIVFKGSGWYITDSRKEDAERAKKVGAKPKSEAGESSTESSASSAEGNNTSSPDSTTPSAAAKDSTTGSPASSIGPSSTPA